jgi:MFS family permease
MGSVFSLCQCVISPFLGTREFGCWRIIVDWTHCSFVRTLVSDRYGRKKVLLATMIGNIISALIWLQSTTFASITLISLL